MFDAVINSIDKWVERKVNALGREAISGILAQSGIGPALSIAQRIETAVETGGASELERLAQQVRRELTPSLPFSSILRKRIHGGKLPVWARTEWASSKEDWIKNKWRHDWRSQPRIPAGGPSPRTVPKGSNTASGEWIPGRLPYPVIGATAIGKGKAKTSRKIRRRKRWRATGKAMGRNALASWSSW